MEIVFHLGLAIEFLPQATHQSLDLRLPFGQVLVRRSHRILSRSIHRLSPLFL